MVFSFACIVSIGQTEIMLHRAWTAAIKIKAKLRLA